MHAKPRHQPPALLTALRTLRTFCAVSDVLLADAVLVCFAVASWTCADTSLETPATQNLTAADEHTQTFSVLNMKPDSPLTQHDSVESEMTA